MKFYKLVKKLEKKGIVGKWPPVWIPFAMTAILLFEAYVFPIERYKSLMYYAGGFALLYAISHWNAVRILNRKPNRQL